MTDTAITHAKPARPNPVAGESETTFRRRMADWEATVRNAARAAEAQRIDAEKAAKERSMVKRIADRAKEKITRAFDRSTPAGYMASKMFSDRADAVLAYAKAARRVAAQAQPKSADVAALGDAALALEYTPAQVERDLAALRRHNEKRPELEQRMANREKSAARSAAAVERFKRAEKELAAARQERSEAANEANRCATARSELEELERGLGELAMTREQLVEKFARESKTAEPTRLVAGVAYAI